MENWAESRNARLGESRPWQNHAHHTATRTPYLDIEFIDILEKVLDAVFALSCMQKHELDVRSRQEGGDLLVIDLQSGTKRW